MRPSIFVLAVVGLLALCMDALGCSRRDGHPADEQLFAEATTVVVATITSVEQKRALPSECDAVHCDYAEVTYAVVERFKGAAGSTGTVMAGHCVACSFCFQVGQQYLFFVNSEGAVDPLNGSTVLDADTREENAIRIEALRAYTVN